MTRKVQTQDTNFAETIAEATIVGWNFEADDPETNRHNEVTGELNPYYNLGALYQLGSRVDQSAYTLAKKKEWFDTAEDKRDKEREINGSESALLIRLEADFIKAEAALENAQLFFEADIMVFNALSGRTWADGKLTPQDPYGRQWFAVQKAEASNKRVLAPKAPTDKERAKIAEQRKQEALARLAS
jgi:hypothetical protein